MKPSLWFLHISDYFTRCSVSWVVRSIKKEFILEKILKHRLAAIFGSPNKFLVGDRGQFANSDFITFCENFNTRIYTTATESPWSNGKSWYKAVMDLTATKTITDTVKRQFQGRCISTICSYRSTIWNSVLFKNFRKFSWYELW